RHKVETFRPVLPSFTRSIGPALLIALPIRLDAGRRQDRSGGSRRPRSTQSPPRRFTGSTTQAIHQSVLIHAESADQQSPSTSARDSQIVFFQGINGFIRSPGDEAMQAARRRNGPAPGA